MKECVGRAASLMHIREAVGRAIALLEDAGRELGQAHDAAKSSITRATSILLMGIGPPEPDSPRRDGVAGLLPWQVRRVIGHIEGHLGQPIRVGELSALIYRTTAHFSRAFKRSFGVTPHAYVLRRRIELASQLMIETDTPLSL